MEVRESPDKYRGQTMQWYGQYVSAVGTRAMYVGAKSSDGPLVYRFLADFGPGAVPPPRSGVISGKFADMENVAESTVTGATTSQSVATLPLLVEAKLEPFEKYAANQPSVEIVESGQPAAAAKPADTAGASGIPEAYLRPNFWQVIKAPGDFKGKTVSWLGRFVSVEGKRVTYIGAVASDGGTVDLFVAEFAQNALPPNVDVMVTGKIAGTATVPEGVTLANGAKPSSTTIPLLVEATFRVVDQPQPN
jgi:hypothetical protein